MLRSRQSHDIRHVLTGYEADVRGEVLLRAFTWAQLGAPASLVIAALGYVRFGRKEGITLADLPDASGRGKATGMLATFRWEDHWTMTVADLCAKLACPPSRGRGRAVAHVRAVA